jgi:S1-C subfamily serine protease
LKALSTFHLNKFKAIDLNNRSDQKQEERHENNQKQQQTNFRRIFTVGCVISSLFLCPRKMLFAHEDQTKPPNRRMMFNFIADVVEDVLPSTVKIELKQHGMFGSGSISNGSGFIISSDGLIITNAHVIRDQSSNPIVELHGGRTFKSKVIKIDKFLDLALIKIECVRAFLLPSIY